MTGIIGGVIVVPVLVIVWATLSLTGNLTPEATKWLLWFSMVANMWLVAGIITEAIKASRK